VRLAAPGGSDSESERRVFMARCRMMKRGGCNSVRNLCAGSGDDRRRSEHGSIVNEFLPTGLGEPSGGLFVSWGRGTP